MGFEEKEISGSILVDFLKGCPWSPNSKTKGWMRKWENKAKMMTGGESKC